MMENSYGVGIVNRYALFLDDESDPFDALKAREQAKELKKKSKEAEKENKDKPKVKPTSKVSKGTPATRKGIKETQIVKTQDNRSGEQPKSNRPVRPANERNVERPPRRRPEDRPQNGSVENKEGAPRPPRREFGYRKPNYERRDISDNPDGAERRGPRPPREPRDGPRAPRPYDNRCKREFDRRSGSDKTGVKPVDKREDAGPHKWDTLKDNIDELNKTGSEGEVVEEKAPEAASAGAGNGQPPEAERAALNEVEPRELTLDEYKALRNAQRTAPQYNLRKAGEGEDLSQWKNLVMLERKKEGEQSEDEDSDEEYDLGDYPQRVGRQKRVLGIKFTFNDTARRGGTGVRGRGRGRSKAPPRDEPSEERLPLRSQMAPPKVDDNKDFPCLG